MASAQDFVEFIADQMQGAGTITYRKMFGEYAVYCEGKVIGLICDNRLFIKPTDGGRVFMGGELIEDYPYPGAKAYFSIEDKFEDREWISELVRITADELPEPKPKKKKIKGELR
ncbi:MAG: TfoX/Sxy family protein [Spirochaetes bacterium]|nr:TfoX/Sxy family protein [Spirochaetota bacterium]